MNKLKNAENNIKLKISNRVLELLRESNLLSYDQFVSKLKDATNDNSYTSKDSLSYNGNIFKNKYIIFYTGVHDMMSYNQFKRFRKLCKIFGEDNVFINMYINKNDTIPWQFKIQNLVRSYKIPYEKIALYNHTSEIIGFGDMKMYKEELFKKIKTENRKIIFVGDNSVKSKRFTYEGDYQVINDDLFYNTHELNTRFSDKVTSRYVVSGWTNGVCEDYSEEFWKNIIELLFNENISREDKINSVYEYFNGNKDIVRRFMKNIEKNIINLYALSDEFKQIKHISFNNENADLVTPSNFGTYLLQSDNNGKKIISIYNKILNADKEIESKTKERIKKSLLRLVTYHGVKMLEMRKYLINNKKLNEITTSDATVREDDGPSSWVGSFKHYLSLVKRAIKKLNYDWIISYPDKKMYYDEDEIANGMVHITFPVSRFVKGEKPTKEQIKLWMEDIQRSLKPNFKIDNKKQIVNAIKRLTMREINTSFKKRKLNELTIKPNYYYRGEHNPFYVLNLNSDNIDLLKLTFGKSINIERGDIKFKCVDAKNIKKGDIMLFALNNNGRTFFRIVDQNNKDTKYYVKTDSDSVSSKKNVIAHFGTPTRKNSTANSDINEFFSLYFLINKYKSFDYSKIWKDLHTNNGSTGVYNGSKKILTYNDIINDMIIDTEDVKDNIHIGWKNANAIMEDLNKTSFNNCELYWTRRKKPDGIYSKNPSDIIIKLENGNYIGYSNKVVANIDKVDTPKFNTSLSAFFKQLYPPMINEIEKIENDAWNKSIKEIPNDDVKLYMKNNFDITKEDLSEINSKESFITLSKLFKKHDLNFYKDGFYYIYRKNLINNLIDMLKDKTMTIYFLNSIATYTYPSLKSNTTFCPYKLLIGNKKSKSKITEISNDIIMKKTLTNTDKSYINNINFDYDGKKQSFKLSFKTKDNFIFNMSIVIRTRASGGWSGKNLVIQSDNLTYKKQ